MLTKSLRRHEEYSYGEGKFLEMEPAATPNVTVTVCLFIEGYKSHDPPLDPKMVTSFIKQHEGKVIPPYETGAATSDSGAQVTIMGEDHIRHIGLNRNRNSY